MVSIDLVAIQFTYLFYIISNLFQTHARGMTISSSEADIIPEAEVVSSLFAAVTVAPFVSVVGVVLSLFTGVVDPPDPPPAQSHLATEIKLSQFHNHENITAYTKKIRIANNGVIQSRVIVESVLFLSIRTSST